MPAAPPVSYPGVYIQEMPSDVRTIIGVDTATTAFIGRAKRGPENKPTVINSYGDFERVFGGLWLNSSLGYAVSDFYLNGGAKAVIVRVFRNRAPVVTGPAVTAQDVATAARAAAQTIADNGTGPQADAANEVAEAAETAAALLDATPESVAEAAQQRSEEIQGGGDSNPAKAAAQDVAQAALDAISVNDPDAEVDDAAEVTIGVDDAALTLVAASQGMWGNQLTASISHLATPAELTDLDNRNGQFARNIAARYAGVSAEDLFTLTIRDRAAGTTEEFANVTIIDGPRRVDRVLENSSVLVRVKGALPTARPTPVIDAAAAGGTDGQPLDDATVLGEPGIKSGIYSMENADIFNLLCIPPYDGADISAMQDVDPAAVLAPAAKYCEDQRALLIVDPPVDWDTKEDAVDGFPIPGLAPTENAAIYFPRLIKPNPLRDNRLEQFAPCGAIAGIMARTDATRGVWKAPAGLEASLAGVVELTVPLTDAENGELNPRGVNCLRALPAAGNVVWGARTLIGDDRLASQWKYIPVRRTALFIEETIYRNIQWAVFEPNDEPLWAQLRLNLGVFMHGLFRQGAFQGGSPKDAYFVKCDATTTTQADIDKGIVNVIVGFAPLKPAEFIVVYIQQIAGQLAV